MEDFINKQTTINFDGDLKILGTWRAYSDEDIFTILKKNKGGMYILRDSNGKELPAIAKKNVNYFWE